MTGSRSAPSLLVALWYALRMARDPNYKAPGARSTVGSGLRRDAFPERQKKLGELTPDNLEEYPMGAAEVNYSNGASTPAGRSTSMQSSVGWTGLDESEDREG